MNLLKYTTPEMILAAGNDTDILDDKSGNPVETQPIEEAQAQQRIAPRAF